MHGFLGKKSHVLIYCVVGDVFIGGVVESDENVEQYHHDEEGEDVVQDDAEWWSESVEIAEVWRLHYGVGHGSEDEAGRLNVSIVIHDQESRYLRRRCCQHCPFQ